ncbi:Holliday junction resolvase [Thermodesulfobium narugense DSM 14796]|uniref:Putative pre-16S rRNA nuclease n=1 Tax=Thermodesulfobium narugense DSM 14796 TaxID=747365 RepID=M1E6P7_9BACT|nr:Holliday junction resolvase RuvX [Thermodesulfobium narugense]AEE14268.1 Holliday junction resolvase [Thermodesulfobium narugense DSM 14796]
MRYLGIDWGVTHLGLSISDPEEKIVFPLGTITRTTWDKDLNKIKQIIEEKSVEAIVLGDPLRTDFSSASSKSILKVKKKLETIGVKVILFDERYSSIEALKLQKILGNKDKGKIHEIASSIVLKSFLDFLSNTKKNIGER